MDYDFTTGNISKKLIKFTLPILATLILQILYGAVDLLIVGNFGSPSDVSAVSTGAQFISVFINLIAGLATGTTILIANKMGAREYKNIGKVIGAGIFMFIIIAILLTFIVGLNGDFFASLINAPEKAFSKTSIYISTLGYGSFFLVAYNVLGSIFRGLGNSKVPLYTVLLSTVINFILDVIFVRNFHMGAFGAAVATVIAQLSSVVFSLFFIIKIKTNFKFSLKDIRYHKKYTNSTLTVGLPVAINGFLVSLSFTFILGIANQFGVVISAGVGITERIIGFLLLVPLAFSQSIATFVAQNVGAHKDDRARKGLMSAIYISLVISIIMIFVSLMYGKEILSIFSKDEAIIAAAFEYLKSYCFDIFFTVFLFNSIGYFNGYSKTKFTMISGVMGGLLVRIPVSYLFSKVTPVSVFLIGLGTPIGTVFQLILSFFYYKKLQETIKRRQRKNC
ncbi:MATE family efflux transporter [Fusobacterium sp. MFO224]|uniref:MATE family efflux transporter n=1 Tax=Fusobacterium sp. MFO224 TaxID=3378070 RepID=UPI003854E5AC